MKPGRLAGLDALREQGRMTWTAEERGWVAAPEEIVTALSDDGFQECKREMTTSRRDLRPAGGVWQGVNARTGTVASAIWVNRPGWQDAVVFIDIDGASFGSPASSTLERDPYREDGGED